MATNSTSKMLARMTRRDKVVAESETPDIADEPRNQFQSNLQAKPNSDMEEVLAQILGTSATKKLTPSDK